MSMNYQKETLTIVHNWKKPEHDVMIDSGSKEPRLSTTD